MQLETQTRIREISLGIKKIHEDLRSKYSILSHQNIMGFLIFSLSIAADLKSTNATRQGIT